MEKALRGTKLRWMQKSRKDDMKPILAVLLLCSICAGQESKYWTKRRIAETSGVTALHLADTAQTCYHMANGSHEMNPLTPNSCAGASVTLIGSGPVLQWASYKLARRYRWMRPIERALPYVEMSISINAIRCSSTKAGCNRYGF